MNLNFTANKCVKYFGSHISLKDQRVHQNCRINDYDIVYDFLVLSTITKKKGKVNKDNPQDSSLRNQYFRM